MMMMTLMMMMMCGCWGSSRVSGRETAGRRVDETRWLRQDRDRLLHVPSSLGSTVCRQPVRRRHRQLHYSTSVLKPSHYWYTFSLFSIVGLLTAREFIIIIILLTQ